MDSFNSGISDLKSVILGQPIRGQDKNAAGGIEIMDEIKTKQLEDTIRGIIQPVCSRHCMAFRKSGKFKIKCQRCDKQVNSIRSLWGTYPKG